MSEEEAKRAIRRLEDEQEKLMAAPDAGPEDDPIDKLGRRIARVLSYVIAAALVYYLWTQLRA